MIERRKTLRELCQEFSATQILFLLGETLLLDIDKGAEVVYGQEDEPKHLVFKMKNGRAFRIAVEDMQRTKGQNA